ncbi:hypothetical protein F0562_019319 [Nyssa sinensis]|uniref:Uncharacterized protein n=1 Tax=Nyssa sinensis TaxID=561372 RepID=A0A5J4ZCI5_9ASTE|nr:hypothetical protein F0562_019319 [Nyssa sinensis]
MSPPLPSVHHHRQHHRSVHGTGMQGRPIVGVFLDSGAKSIDCRPRIGLMSFSEAKSIDAHKQWNELSKPRISLLGSDPTPSASPMPEQSLNRWPPAPPTAVAEKDRNESVVAEEKKGDDVMVSSYWGICPRGKAGRFSEQMVGGITEKEVSCNGKGIVTEIRL